MRSPWSLAAVIGLLLVCGGCAGGSYVDLPMMPSSTCYSCGPTFFAPDSPRK